MLSTLLAPVEDFTLPPGQERFDVVFACRVGVLDGRHPQRYAQALTRIRAVLRPGGQFLVDTGHPLN